jgi:serine/threonine protein kinase
MATPTTIPDFLQLVRKSGLVPEKALNAFVERLGTPAGGEEGQVEKLANAMVREGLLSIFQAEKLLEGKWRGFTIGKFKVLERLGSGGLGNVYLCEHIFTHQRMAVKVLRNVNADDPVSVKRFYREAQAAAALTHPNIVRAYDVGEDGQLHFLVMDYVEGASLHHIVHRGGPMSILRACHYIHQAALGLQYAHEHNFVHRDIKPSNLLLDRQGTVKILDMGLARITEEGADVLTKGGDILGSADYLAPEQAVDSHGVDIRADIYGLGGTFYYLLAGAAPFADAKTVPQKLIVKQTKKPKCIRTLRPEVPEQLAAIVERMLATDPAGRYATPTEVAEALAPFVTKPILPPPGKEMPKPSPAASGPPVSDSPPAPGQDSWPSKLQHEKAKLVRVDDGTPSPFLAKAKSPACEPPSVSRPKRETPASGTPPAVPTPARTRPSQNGLNAAPKPHARPANRPAPSPKRGNRRPRKRRWLVAAVLLLGAIAAGAVLWWVLANGAR